MKFEDIIYEKDHGIARLVLNRPDKMNAFRPQTTDELIEAVTDATHDPRVGVVVLTGSGNRAFCVGGDQSVRAKGGYQPKKGARGIRAAEFYRMVRYCPKPVIAAVNGYAVGGGNVMHLVCDMTIASDKATFGQVGPRVGSFDAGFGTALLARAVGEKKAKEIWLLCRRYTAQQALEMGLVNMVVPADKLMEETDKVCREILSMSPTAVKFVKMSFNADTDGICGISSFSSLATKLFYGSDEAVEGRNAFMEKRNPDYTKFGEL